MKKKPIRSYIPVYIAAATAVALGLVLPVPKLWALILCGVGAVVTGTLGVKLISPAKVYKPKETETQQQASQVAADSSPYSPEVQAIIKEGALAQQEMGRLYASIDNKEIRHKINQVMQVSDKIVQDAMHDPTDVPQIKKFLSYYLPTTIKLLNAYDRMDSQGIEGSNISGTKKNIEEMLDTAIAAYRKQLDSLFANQALDIDTDIQVMNAMLAREGLADDMKTSSATSPPNTGYESPFGAASPMGSAASGGNAAATSPASDGYQSPFGAASPMRQQQTK